MILLLLMFACAIRQVGTKSDLSTTSSRSTGIMRAQRSVLPERSASPSDIGLLFLTRSTLRTNRCPTPGDALRAFHEMGSSPVSPMAAGWRSARSNARLGVRSYPQVRPARRDIQILGFSGRATNIKAPFSGVENPRRC
jgi:hypothetical protein